MTKLLIWDILLVSDALKDVTGDMANPLRGEVIRLYKNVNQYWELCEQLFVSCASDCFKSPTVLAPLKLLYLGREYPQGSAYFRERLKSAFMKNKDVTDPEKIKKLVARGEFVIKEIEALYFLKKYRAMKKRYYEPDKWLPWRITCHPIITAIKHCFKSRIHYLESQNCVSCRCLFCCAMTCETK